MNRFVVRATVGCAALVLGVLAGSIHQHVVQKRLSANVAQFSPTEPPPQLTEVIPLVARGENYPEEAGLTPRDIELFIDEHPRANLKRLWERLRIHQNDFPLEGDCGNCKAESGYYNFDDDIHGEVLLRIADGSREWYRYLVFKFARMAIRSCWDT